MLYGREAELRVVASLIDGLATGAGGALLVSGEAGIGKSALLAAAAERAAAAGVRVLSATGVEAEARLPFAGLHQLLRPVLPLADRLPDRQRAALLSAFGMAEAEPSVAFLIGLATLELISDAAASAPVLLIADDVQWLDEPSRDGLAFVARRLADEPAAALFAVREGGQFEGAGLPRLRLTELAGPAAAALLDARSPKLDPELRDRLLALAAGNPLALVELPKALPSGSPLPGSRLPLTARLERAFAAQESSLPDAARTVLLVAAADDGGTLPELLAAASAVDGAEITPDALLPIVTAGLAEIDEAGLRFRHPLVRSGAAKIDSFVRQAERLRAAGRADAAATTLSDIAMRCYWGNPGPQTRAAVIAAAERLPAAGAGLAQLIVLAAADPVQRGAAVNAALEVLPPDHGDPAGMNLAGIAAGQVWAWDRALPLLDVAVHGLRSQGRLGLLVQGLATQAWAAAHLARPPVVLAAADEAARLAGETGQGHRVHAARLAQSMVAAAAGDDDDAEAMIRQAEAGYLAMGALPMLSLVQFARGRAAIVNLRYAEALAQLRRILDPADPAHHPFVGTWGLADLVEAAVQGGELDTARSYLGQLESLAAATSGPLLRAGAAYARPLVTAAEEAGDAEAGDVEGLYLAALGEPLTVWPGYRSRMLLAYGVAAPAAAGDRSAGAAAGGARFLRRPRVRPAGRPGAAGAAGGRGGEQPP